MKNLSVVLNERAERQLEDAYLWWASHRSGEQAARWYNGFLDALEGLSVNPERCSLADESSQFGYDIRQLLFGLGTRPTHRALFIVREEMVYVFSIRHVAQDVERPTID